MSLYEELKKKIVRFKHHKPGRGGWSEWIYPSKKYLMKCCDCGLVHEIEFATFLERNRRKDGYFQAIKLPDEIRSMFRVRRYKK